MTREKLPTISAGIVIGSMTASKAFSAPPVLTWKQSACFATYPSEDQPGLRVSVANPRYLFAMKCRAMRIGGVEESPDVNDIRQLAREIGITSSEDALRLVAEFYSNNVLEPKVRFGLEKILDNADPSQPESSQP